jgi:hypothetical protein
MRRSGLIIQAFALLLLMAVCSHATGKRGAPSPSTLAVRWELLLVHLSHHRGAPDEATEFSLDHLVERMKWSPGFGERVVAYVTRNGLAQQVDDGSLRLTDRG